MQIDIYRKENDIGEFVAFCHNMIAQSYYPAYSREVLDMFLIYHSREQIASDVENGRVWCAREGGALVGTVTVAGRELTRMFVSPVLRGRGLGAALAREALSYARDAGVVKLTAWSVPFSRGFYEKLGFVMLNADTLDFHNRRDVPVPYIEMALWPAGTEEISIGPAVEADAGEMLAGQRLAFEEQCKIYDDWHIPPMSERPEEFCDFLRSGGTVLRASCAGRIIGGVRGKVVNGNCEVGRLFVQPAWQGRHVACRLLAELEKSMTGCAAFSLFTGERSEKNIALYARQGYALTGRRVPATDPGSPGCYDLVWMEKPNPWPAIEECARRFHSR